MTVKENKSSIKDLEKELERVKAYLDAALGLDLRGIKNAEVVDQPDADKK